MSCPVPKEVVFIGFLSAGASKDKPEAAAISI